MSRGWGNTPPDLKGTLGTLLRTTLIQLGSLRDAAVRELGERGRDLGAQASQALRGSPMMQGSPHHQGLFSPGSEGAQTGGFQTGGARLAARRGDILATIGEIIYELARAKELDLDEFPELRDAIRELEQIDSDLDGFGSPNHGGEGVGKRVAPNSLASDFTSHENAHDEDGVTSTFDVFAKRERPSSGAIWRPDPSDYNLDGSLSRDMDPYAPNDAVKPESAMSTLQKNPTTTRPTRRTGSGQISFVSDDVEDNDDEDLSEYMHDDDVP